MLLSNIDFETSLSNDESGSSFNVKLLFVCVHTSVQFIVSSHGWYLCWRIYVFLFVSISITSPQSFSTINVNGKTK